MDENKMRELVAATKLGDTQSFSRLYEMTSHTVYFICYSIMQNEQDAQDVMQETYVASYMNLMQLEDEAKYGAWINKIAVNKCKHALLKKGAPMVDYDEVAPIAQEENENFLPEDYIVNKEKRKQAMDIMRNVLSPIQYQTVLLYYFNGLKISEIGEIMECPEGTVKYRLSIAKSKIKAGVIDYEVVNNDKLYAHGTIPFLASLLAAASMDLNVPNIFDTIVTGITALFASGTTVSTGLVGGVAAQQTAMGGIATQQTVMGSGAAQQTAMGGVATQQTVMGSGAVQQTAMGSGAVQQTAMGGAIAQQTAMGTATAVKTGVAVAVKTKVIIGVLAGTLAVSGATVGIMAHNKNKAKKQDMTSEQLITEEPWSEEPDTPKPDDITDETTAEVIEAVTEATEEPSATTGNGRYASYRDVVTNMAAFIEDHSARLSCDYIERDYMCYDYDEDGEIEVILYLGYYKGDEYMRDIAFLDYDEDAQEVVLRAVNKEDPNDTMFYMEYKGKMARYSWRTSPMESYIYSVMVNDEDSLIYVLEEGFDYIVTDIDEAGMHPLPLYGDWEIANELME